MRLVPFLLAATLSAPPLRAQTEADAHAAVAAVLAYERAERSGSGGPLCVRAELAPPLEGLRQARSIEDEADRVAQAAARARSRRWSAVPPRAGQSRDADAALAARLDRLLDKALRGIRPAIAPLTASMVSPPFRLDCHDERERLSFSTPALIEDFAFVERSYGCGRLCGSGAMLALQRRDGRWIVVASFGTWVS